MNHAGLLRQMVSENRAFLEGTIGDVTQEQALWQPDGRALPIAAQYAHVIIAQDFGLHGLIRPATPLAMGAWTARTGMQQLPPPLGSQWEEWGRQSFDLAALRAYGQAVYAVSDAYFETLDDAELGREVDLASAGFGVQTVGFVLLNGWVTNVSLHTGEISCLKGLQQAQGYPA